MDTLRRHPKLVVWIAALAATGVAFGVRLALDPILGHAAPFVFFILVATVVAWFGGALPGLAVTVAGLLLGNYFFTAPKYSFIVATRVEWVQSLTFAAEGLLLSSLCEIRLRARRLNARYVVQLRGLASDLTLAEQRHRRGLAQELHDHLQQLLVAAKLQNERVARSATPEQARAIATIEDVLNQAIHYTRDLTAQLGSPLLHTQGLAAALRSLDGEFQRRHGLTIDTRGVEDEASPIPEDTRVLMFQVVRELLFNVVKHAGAPGARIAMSAAGDAVRVTVEDDGRGFDASQPRATRDDAGGLGLFSARERVLACGGALRVDTAPARGTRVTVTLPLESGACAGGAADPGAAGSPAQPQTRAV